MPRLVVLLLALVASCTVAVARPAHADVGPPADTNWSEAAFDYRLPLTIDPGSTARVERPAVVAVDFGAAIGGAGTFDPATIRVVEVDADGAVVDGDTPFQFDPDPGDADAGELVVLLTGTTAAGASRDYFVYFDVTGTGAEPASMSPRVSVTEGIVDAGQPAYALGTQAGTWFLQEDAGAFSSLVDATGQDWLSYGSATGSAGQFRGMPNAVHPDGHFHPGSTTSPAALVSSGPLRARFVAATADGRWQLRYDVFPRFVTMTMLRAGAPYWWLYEGTPGGQIDADSDVVIRSDGTQTPLGTAWSGDLAGDEWAAFADTVRNRSLFVAHHESDTSNDSHRLMENNMTVFGFGRTDLTKHLTGTHTFTAGLLEAETHGGIAPRVRDATRPTSAVVGEVQVQPAPPPTTTTTTTTTTQAPTTTTTTSTTQPPGATTTTTQPSSGGGGGGGSSSGGGGSSTGGSSTGGSGTGSGGTTDTSPTIVRLAGADRIATSIAASRDRYDAAAGAVLASSTTFADGLVGAPLAVRAGGPLLLTGVDALDERVAGELRRVLPPGATVYLLGGTAALSDAVRAAVESLGFAPVRLAGLDRYETSVVVARDGIGDPAAVLLATGADFPDALAAGAAAAHLRGAVLLTDGDTLPDSVAWYLATRPGLRRIAIGGPAADADHSAEPIVGANRYDTAVRVAERLFTTRTTFGLATGTAWADALSGGSHAGSIGAALLLTPPDHLATEVRDHTIDVELDQVWIYGGSGAVSDAVVAELSA